MYTKLLAAIAQRYGVKRHFYADHSRLYVSFDPGNKVDIMNMAVLYYNKSLKIPDLQTDESSFSLTDLV